MKSEWEKEFDKLFPITKGLSGYKNWEIVGVDTKEGWTSLEMELKDFIRTLLSSKLQRIIKFVEWMKYEKPEDMEEACYNDLLSDLIKKIQEEK